MLHIVLYQPEIPPNTGNVIRLAANTGSSLTLVRPLGFELDDSKLRRAGLDYREWAEVSVAENLDEALIPFNLNRVFAFSTKGHASYNEVQFESNDVLLFGPETRGLPTDVRKRFKEKCLRIPMKTGSRSLNLSNAVAVVVYEAWRQLSFRGSS